MPLMGLWVLAKRCPQPQVTPVPAGLTAGVGAQVLPRLLALVNWRFGIKLPGVYPGAVGGWEPPRRSACGDCPPSVKAGLSGGPKGHGCTGPRLLDSVLPLSWGVAVCPGEELREERGLRRRTGRKGAGVEGRA